MLQAAKLSSKSILPSSVTPDASAKGHLCIAHGLLGNAMNWCTAGRYVANHSALKGKLSSITSLDLRNHGSSPHMPVHTNAVLASDLEQVLLDRSHDLPSTARQVFMAHSMGGLALVGLLLRRYNEAALLPTYPDEAKSAAERFAGWKDEDQRDVRAAMRLINKNEGVSETYALRDTLFNETPGVHTNGAMTAAVVVDITPTITVGSDIRETLKAMTQVDMSKIHSLDDAHCEMRRVGMDDKNMRDFFSTNIVFKKNEKATWRCNLPVLAAHTDLFQPTITQWFLNFKEGKGMEPKPCTLPTLFVFGEKSVYNREDMKAQIPKLFPNSQQIVVSGAGHFVHHEKPAEFANAVAPFISQYV